MAAKSLESKMHLCNASLLPFPQSAGWRWKKDHLSSTRRWSTTYANEKKTSFLRASRTNRGIPSTSAILNQVRCNKDTVKSYSVTL